MGHVLDLGFDEAYRHVGSVRHLLENGELADTYQPELGEDMPGWLLCVCECGWRGEQMWPHDNYPGYPPTYEREEDVLREWEGHVHAAIAVDQKPDYQALTRQLNGIAERGVDGGLDRLAADLTSALEQVQRLQGTT